MPRSPFLSDPRVDLSRHLAQAIASPIETAREFHIGLAEHFAALAKASDLPLGAVTPDAKPRDHGD